MTMEAEDKPKPKKLKDQIKFLKMEKRVGLYTGDPENPTRGIFKDPDKAKQKAFKKNIVSQIRAIRRGTSPLPNDQQSVAADQ